MRRIKQLSHAYMVYPSAVHTRFEHSIGAAHIAGRMCDELQLNKKQKRLVRIAVLLHDIGHGPFSHLFEHALQKINPGISEIHEQISRLIIERDEEIDSILGNDKEKVIELLGNNEDTTSNDKNLLLQSQIVSSGLDADKLDYLRRDSYHIGAAYGVFDLERILYTLKKTPGSYPRLAVDIKGKDALENYRVSRYMMHAQVYEHHARLAADRRFLQGLDIAIHDEEIIDRNILKINSSEFLSFYKTLDDDAIYNLIINNPRATLSSRILNENKQRKLLKCYGRFGVEEISDEETQIRMLQMSQGELDRHAARLAHTFNLAPHDLIFYRSDIKIKLFGKGDLLVVDKRKIYDLKEISPIFAKEKVVKFYVFGPKYERQNEWTPRKIVSRLIALINNDDFFQE